VELKKNEIWINLASFSFFFGYFCLLMAIVANVTFYRRILHLDVTVTLLDAKQESLNGLAILSIENDILAKLEYKSLIKNFASQRARRIVSQ